ncbi:choice-of-anchor L domain-containing protein [Candidatus Saccharibacteria bacterium]|nr:choice-of-anchor L domain-containing protein [Candidatus Saccharibacteria bacterium]
MLKFIKRGHLKGIFVTSLIFTAYALSALFSGVSADSSVPELLTDVTPLSAQSLANAVLGGSLTATNATSHGTIYTFSQGIDLVGIDSGIILDTSGNSEPNAPNDSDLHSLMDYSYGGHTSSLEFTIVATGKLLNFNYVFVSTEFDQDPKYNDNFGLFVSVNGGAYENIATIPLTTGAEVPININNLRSGINANNETTRLSISAETSAHNYQQHSLFNSAPININNSTQKINGVSNVFNAQKSVSVGDTVKIKFAIADVSDTAFDSYVLIEADSLSFEEQLARVNYAREVIERMYSGRTYEITTEDNTYTFTSSSNGEVPLSGTDKNGEEYDFMGETITLVRKGIGNQPDSEPQTIVVAGRPTAPTSTISTPTGEPDDMYIDDVEITEDSISLPGNNGQEYSIDLVDWQSPDGNGYVSFENLTPNTEYIVYTRFEATEDTPASDPAVAATIVTQNMARNLTYSITNYEGMYDGEPHAAYVSNASGAEIRYSEDLYGTYTGVIPHFTEPGHYTVYYYLAKENYYPAYGALSVKIKDYNVINSTNETTNFGNAKLLHTSAELKQMMVYTDEEKESLADAETPAEISLVSTDVTDDVDDEIIDQFTAELEEGEHIGAIINFSLYQKLLANSTQLTLLPAPVNISFKVPTALVLANDDKAVRAYRVLRLHDDEVEDMDAEIDENRVISFSTDRFSYYALTYKDVVYEDDSPLIPDTAGTVDSDTTAPLTPDTGEMEQVLASARACAVSTIVVSIMSALVAIFAYFRLKNLKIRLKNTSR